MAERRESEKNTHTHTQPTHLLDGHGHIIHNKERIWSERERKLKPKSWVKTKKKKKKTKTGKKEKKRKIESPFEYKFIYFIFVREKLSWTQTNNNSSRNSSDNSKSANVITWIWSLEMRESIRLTHSLFYSCIHCLAKTTIVAAVTDALHFSIVHYMRN